MSYLLTLLLSMLGLSATPAETRTIDDQTLIAQQNAAQSPTQNDAVTGVQITQDGFAAFFHS